MMIKRALLVPAATLLLAQAVWATDLRGQVKTTHPYADQPFAAKNVDVALEPARGDSAIDRTQTGTSGYYYFRGVEPGEYTLLVRPGSDDETLRYKITVRDVERQEIQSLLLR